MSVVLNRRLVLEAASRLPDGAGGYAETWVVLGELWADIRSGATWWRSRA
jgi:head-tail adaptor